MSDNGGRNGFALVGVLVLLALLMTLLVGYFALARIELSTTKSTMRSFRGFYAAEAGLNVRADLVRQAFDGYVRPAGSAPDSKTKVPCTGTNLGSGDMRCMDYVFQQRDVTTYVEEHPSNPNAIVIPRGEPFQNLSAQEYRYVVYSVARGAQDLPEAILEMHFKSRLVPLFQFVAFYDKDLEVMPAPSMMLTGPVHANGDIYMGTGGTLSVLGQITTAGDLYQGYKSGNSCPSGTVKVMDPDNLTALPSCGGSRRLYTEAELASWNDQILIGLDALDVPSPDMLRPVSGELYWDHADLRVVLDLNGGSPAIKVYNANGTEDATRSATLNGCGVAGYNATMYNQREGKFIKMLNINLRGLLDCAHVTGLMDGGKALDDTSDGGLVWYFTVDGPDSSGINGYGVRVRNGAELASSILGAPAIQGLTVVSDQAMYVKGDFNATNKKPAAFMADSMNVLSNAWNDANSALALTNRVASDTTVYAAMLAGTDTTGGVEGSAGQDLGQYNGGLENFTRLHEHWSGNTFTYLGSFVSLSQPLHVNGNWVYGTPQYLAPTRVWAFDDDFNDAALLPPLTPRFVYLRQELFVRQFEM